MLIIYQLNRSDVSPIFQIQNILFHKRDKKTGEIQKIKLPKENIPKPIEEDKPKTLKDNPRYIDYFKQFESLVGMLNRNWITEENYKEQIIKLKAKYPDITVEIDAMSAKSEDKKVSYDESYNNIKGMFEKGMITEEVFNQSVQKLKEVSGI